MIRVMLVDDATLLRQTLAMALNRRRGFEVANETASGARARELLRSQPVDVAVVDPCVEDGGLDLLADLSASEHDTAVLVLTNDATEISIVEALRCGVRGFLSKQCELSEVEAAIERVHKRELVLEPSAVDAVIQGVAPTPSSTSADAFAGLTPRELEVARLVAAGHTNPEIAEALCITEHTTKGHLARILRKLGLNNRVQLATLAMQQETSSAEAKAESVHSA